MREFTRIIGRFVVLAVLALIVAPAIAAPGGIARNQNRYPAIRDGAQNLAQAYQALERGTDVFKGHRVKAMQEISTALTELDLAVNFADKNTQPGEKGQPFFNAEHGKLALSQNKYPAIQAGAKNLMDAGRRLDAGFDRFGGHRIDALKAIHRALDELDAAVREAR